MIQAGIVMVRPGEHDDSNPVLAFDLIDRFAGALADAALVRVELTEAGLDGPRVLLRRQPEHRRKRIEQLLAEQLPVARS